MKTLQFSQRLLVGCPNDQTDAMTTRKRQDWLETELDDGDESQGYDSEEAELRRDSRLAGLPRSQSKRRKLAEDAESDATDDDDDDDDEDDKDKDKGQDTDEPDAASIEDVDHSPSEDPAVDSQDTETTPSTKPPDTTQASNPHLKPLTPEELAATRAATRRTGVVYLSRVPPFMKPAKLRSLLAPFGPVGRIFLTPEDVAAHRARVRAGGNRKRSFADGWVEFRRRRDARLAAETLNARTVGGRKGGFYHDDVWNLRYLRGFKWHHLTEQIAAENAARAARLRGELARTRREDRDFVRNVGRAKMLEGVARKRAKREERARMDGDDVEGGGGGGGDGRGEGQEKVSEKKEDRFQRHFRQNEVKAKSQVDGPQDQPEAVKRVLSKIF